MQALGLVRISKNTISTVSKTEGVLVGTITRVSINIVAILWSMDGI